MPNAQSPKENPQLSKFIQTIDEDGLLVIINLEAVSHVFKFADNALQFYFQQDRVITLRGENANILWEFLTAASWQVYQQPQEADKK